MAGPGAASAGVAAAKAGAISRAGRAGGRMGGWSWSLSGASSAPGPGSPTASTAVSTSSTGTLGGGRPGGVIRSGSTLHVAELRRACHEPTTGDGQPGLRLGQGSEDVVDRLRLGRGCWQGLGRGYWQGLGRGCWQGLGRARAGAAGLGGRLRASGSVAGVGADTASAAGVASGADAATGAGVAPSPCSAALEVPTSSSGPALLSSMARLAFSWPVPTTAELARAQPAASTWGSSSMRLARTPMSRPWPGAAEGASGARSPGGTKGWTLASARPRSSAVKATPRQGSSSGVGSAGVSAESAASGLGPVPAGPSIAVVGSVQVVAGWLASVAEAAGSGLDRGPVAWVHGSGDAAPVVVRARSSVGHALGVSTGRTGVDGAPGEASRACAPLAVPAPAATVPSRGRQERQWPSRSFQQSAQL